MRASFTALAWKDSGGLFFPDGALRTVSCNHINEGLWGLTMKGEEYPLPTSTVPIGQGTDENKVGVARLSPGTVLQNATMFSDSGWKQVIRVKDMDTLQITYFDAIEYLDNYGACNECCNGGVCMAVTPVISGITSNAATASWTANGAILYQFKNVENSGTCVIPADPYNLTANTAVSLTGLTAATTYCFAVRSVCSSGTFSDWSFVQFTTAA